MVTTPVPANPGSIPGVGAPGAALGLSGTPMGSGAAVVVVVVELVDVVVSTDGNVVKIGEVVSGAAVDAASPSAEHETDARTRTINQINLSMEAI